MRENDWPRILGVWVIWFAACIACIAYPAVADDFDTPERAIRAFENAFARGDTTAALAAWDFGQAARLTQRAIFSYPPGFLAGAFAAKMRKDLASSLKQAILDQMHDKIAGRFEIAKCELIQKESLAPTLVQLAQRCTVNSGKEFSQKLIVIRRAQGWRIAQYPSLRFYAPVCFSEAPNNIVVCSEMDGQHVNATKGGRELWRKDSGRDWHIHPYRTIYPVIVSITRFSGTTTDNDLGPGSTVVVTYDSSQFGECAIQSGNFRFVGRN